MSESWNIERRRPRPGAALWPALAACAGLAACGDQETQRAASQTQLEAAVERAASDTTVNDTPGALASLSRERESVFDLFNRGGDGATNVRVNRYLWNASLDVLDFLPIEAVDPFTGVIVMGFGNPPGGGRAYRATVYVQDAALDARSLNVALATRAGPASAETQRAVEDAILTRARQLRIEAGRL